MFEQNVSLGPGVGTFMSHTFELFIMLLGTFLLGLWLGWLLWSKYKRMVEGLEQERFSLEGALEKQREDYEALKGQYIDAELSISKLNYSIEQLGWEKNDFGQKINQVELDLAQQLKINQKLSTDLAATVANNPLSNTIETEVFSSPVDVHLEKLVEEEAHIAARAKELEEEKIFDEALEWKNIKDIEPEFRSLIEQDNLEEEQADLVASSSQQADELEAEAPTEAITAPFISIPMEELTEAVEEVPLVETEVVDDVQETETHHEIAEISVSANSTIDSKDVEALPIEITPKIEAKVENGFSRSSSSSMIVKRVVVRADRSKVIEEEQHKVGDVVDIEVNNSLDNDALAIEEDDLELEDFTKLEIVGENTEQKEDDTVLSSDISVEVSGLFKSEVEAVKNLNVPELEEIQVITELESEGSEAIEVLDLTDISTFVATKDTKIEAKEVSEVVDEPIEEALNSDTQETLEILEGDDFLKITGLTHSVAAMIKKSGIVSYNQLSRTPIAKLKEILGDAYAENDPHTWPAQALLAANGEWKNLESYQKYLINS